MANQDEIQKVWERGKPMPGKDPKLYRQDSMGNKLYRYSYGRSSEMGWEIDHKKPKSKGGSESIRNKQPLQTQENRKKSNKYPYKKK
ncbi:HNH endonuclease domain-containing protein [Spongiimicrobium salis]|uniref:HNH endonuclease domain-containing protein n=1 Tax=Spongiimicrobium salis TaxID=1667022 RepID=UPI00374D4F44